MFISQSYVYHKLNNCMEKIWNFD